MYSAKHENAFSPFNWGLAHGARLELGRASKIMAIVNVTPDSFSDGGQFDGVAAAVEHAVACVTQGASIIDIGGESTRPGAAQVSQSEEEARVLPVIKELATRGNIVISIDTYRTKTAKAAVEAGAHIINDVHGLQREPQIAEVAAETGAGLCIMHTGRGRQTLEDVIADQLQFFAKSLEIAEKAGVNPKKIVLDPGFGFAKETADINFELMSRLAELRQLGFPILVGTSRKRFLGSVTGRGATDRDVATASSCALLRMAGADIFRVHNVAMNKDALCVADAMLAQQQTVQNKP